jgi:methylated-DNA-[protein]-cysteine S-methyltransferase
VTDSDRTTLSTTRLETAVGPLTLFVRGDTLCGLAFAEEQASLVRNLERRFGPVSLKQETDAGGFATALRAYFSGDIGAIEALQVDTGGTDFQRRVWHALRDIPAGETISYGQLAKAVGSPKAVRAVGAANGHNPVPIVIPCHRVIRGDGDLCGYGGGVERKRWLLEHEAAAVGRATQRALFAVS